MNEQRVFSIGDTNRARVLVVDDDERNLLALSEVLGPVAEVVCTSSGRDALRQLLREDFAVILLDVFMPDLDGYETAALIRQREQTARIPIIFLSAVNKETEHLMRGYEMGAVDYVFKPVDPVVLKTKVGVFVDLFNMRRQLEESERRQASILRALPMAIYEATEGEHTADRQFLGGDLAHFLGEEAGAVLRGERRWDDWVHPEDRHRLDTDSESGDAVTTEYRWIGPEGTRHHILDQRIATGSAGGARRWAGSLLDVTERKELEAKLVHAGKLDALGQLTGGVAHDFNNLLAAILGGIGILQRRLELGEKDQFVFDQMHRAATQGADLVRRLTAFARQQELAPTSVAPGELCESVAGLVNHSLGGLVTVEWQCRDVNLSLFVDRGQLELALTNLIINARDAMPAGGVVTVNIDRAHEAPADRPMLRIRVSDTGCGMPPEVLERVTEPFFTTKQVGKGTGLGLSMVAGFIEQSGGELRIASVEGEGTSIELLLPATEARPEAAAAADTADLDWLSGKRLLLVDDDDAVRTMLLEHLRDAGGEVEDCRSGEDAIAAIRQSPDRYDYVLSDFAMPGLNGLDTLRQIGDLAPGVRAALMTGNATDMRDAGHATVPILRKPFELGELARVFAG